MSDGSLMERALRISDEAMISLIECECMRADDVGVTYLPTDEAGNVVGSVADASPAVIEAVDWLFDRGLCFVRNDVLIIYKALA